MNVREWTKDRRGWLLVPALLGLALLIASLSLVSCKKDTTVEPQIVRTKRHMFLDSVVTTTNGTRLNTAGWPYLSIDVDGIVTATVTFEATLNGTDWRAVEFVNASDGSKASSTSADGLFERSAGGYDSVRCRVSSYVSGTITVIGQLMESVGEGLDDVQLSSPADGTYIGDIKFGESLPAGTNALGAITVTDVTTGTVDVGIVSNVVTVDATGQGDVPVTLDGEAISGTVDVNAVSGVVAVDATGQGDVPVTLGGEAITGTVNVNTVNTVSGVVSVDSELPAAAALADGATNPTVPGVGAAELLFNGATWDRERNNYSVWPFPKGQRTYVAPIIGETVPLVNYNARGAYIVVDITGIGLNQTLTVEAYVFDYDGIGGEASDQQEIIWASAALTPTGRHTYLIYPGAGAAAQDVVATVSYPLPRLWNLGVTVTNSEPITFSIGVHYIN